MPECCDKSPPPSLTAARITTRPHRNTQSSAVDTGIIVHEEACTAQHTSRRAQPRPPPVYSHFLAPARALALPPHLSPPFPSRSRWLRRRERQRPCLLRRRPRRTPRPLARCRRLPRHCHMRPGRSRAPGAKAPAITLAPALISASRRPKSSLLSLKPTSLLSGLERGAGVPQERLRRGD